MVQLDELIDKVQIVTRGDGRGAPAAARQTFRCMMQRLMYVDARVDDCVAVRRRQVQRWERRWEVIGSHPVLAFQVHFVGELFAHMEQGRVGPVAEPVEHATTQELKKKKKMN